MHNYFLAVAGNMGVGKTELTKLLGKELDAEIFLELPEENDNPFLESYYENPKLYAFKSQFWFLINKISKIRSIENVLSDHSVVLDRPLEEDVEIFAKNTRQLGYMDEQEYKLYLKYYNQLKLDLISFDLTIYLKSSVETLIERIKSRSRAYEKGITEEYLSSLNLLYDEFCQNYKGRLLTINTDNIDFVNNLEDQDDIVSLVKGELAKIEKY